MSKIPQSYVSHNLKRIINNPINKLKKIKTHQNSPYRSQSNKFKNTMINIKRQLSNISLGEKIIYTSRTRKEENYDKNEFINNLIILNDNNLNKICHIESFNIINNYQSKYDKKNLELEKENKKLKENIKFLLNEKKKKEDSKENNIENKILKEVINEYERKLKLVEEKYTIIIQENLKLKKNFNDMYLKYSSISRNNIIQDNKTCLSPQINNSIFSLSDDIIKENNSKFNNDIGDTNISIMHKSCSSIYIKKIPKLLKSNSTIELINEQNKSFNLLNSFTRNSIKKIDSKIIKFTNKKNNNNIPILSFSPTFIYNIFQNNFTKEMNNKNIIITFNINNKKFSKKNYIEGTSNFNEIYNNNLINHENDLILSLSNGAIIITGEETNKMFFYNNLNNYIYNLQNLNHNHNKGGLIQYDNNKLICISGMKNSTVEIYNIKDNQWNELSKMNRVHCESAYIIINNNILYSFFGFDYENNCYIEDIEYLNLNNYFSKWEILKINQKINIRGHSLFNLYNNNSENFKIFLIGGYNNIRSNKGLIEIELNNFEAKILDGFVKNDDEKNKNNINEDYIFSTTFFINYDNETNKNFIYNTDKNLNIHIIDIDTLNHNVYKCHIFT